MWYRKSPFFFASLGLERQVDTQKSASWLQHSTINRFANWSCGKVFQHTQTLRLHPQRKMQIPKISLQQAANIQSPAKEKRRTFTAAKIKWRSTAPWASQVQGRRECNHLTYKGVATNMGTWAFSDVRGWYTEQDRRNVYFAPRRDVEFATRSTHRGVICMIRLRTF